MAYAGDVQVGHDAVSVDANSLTRDTALDRPNNFNLMTGTGLVPHIEETIKQLLPAVSQAPEWINQQLATFRDRFGPEVLGSLDGEALLRRMHGRQGEDARQCLAYWLEFKNDEEFASSTFGGIAGGNAAKFGVYQRDADGAWLIGRPGEGSIVPLSEAVAKARQQRDELLAGHEVLAHTDPLDLSDAAYARLQGRVQTAAPDLYKLIWAHKWWFLIHPDRLDSYHSPSLQRFHLVKLLQVPPSDEGTLVGSDAPRFICAGRFVALARAFNVPIVTLAAALNRLHGSLHGYWRVGTRDSGNDQVQWPAMRDGGFVSIGWKDQVPDMSEAIRGTTAEARAWVRTKLDESGIYAHHLKSGTATAKAGELVNLAQVMAEGDLVLACDGQTVLGVGRVCGPYRYDESLVFAHTRPVEWLSVESWTLPQTKEGYLTSCVRLGKYAANQLEAERRLLDPIPPPSPPPQPQPGPKPYVLPPLDPQVARIGQVLDRKGQVLLYGPPGTGKTHWALTAARELAARQAFRRAYGDLDEAGRAQVSGSDGLVRVCTFHPGYGYEDFMEGLQPEPGAAGQLLFAPRDGIFKRLCAAAAARPDLPFFLVIDEFNRGDVPRIMGELLTILERDKRGTPVVLPVTGQPFAVPDNVHLIGTMNTADRSISLLDAALRRRFGFIELMPNSATLRGRKVGDLPLGPWLDALNARLRRHLKRDARNLQVGHAYLMPFQPITSVAELARVLRHDLVPLLEEYCYEDFATLEAILGKALVDAEAGRIRDEVFDRPETGELLDALRFEEMISYEQASSLDDAGEAEEPGEGEAAPGDG